jgi:hypothetical protein
LVEQRIENPRVGGSIPPQATKFKALDPPQDQGLFALALAVAVRPSPSFKMKRLASPTPM